MNTIAPNASVPTFIGQSQKIANIIEQIRRLQKVDKTSVMILGECGTGKELVAGAIHFGGVRANGPFIVVNCSAIPAELAESLFFGHIRGAFTGASSNRKGYFELAQGGTLFLDEIGELPILLQAKLLRALENKTIIPVGGERSKSIDVRVIAATNADLLAKIQAGTFRPDLYFRLAGYTITVPPLRERQSDIAPLAEHFLGGFATEMGYSKTKLSQSVLTALESYHFPGNVRELKNIIEQALISSHGGPIEPHHLRLLEIKFLPENQPCSPIQSADAVFCSKLDQMPIAHEESILQYVQQHGRITNRLCQKWLNVNSDRASYLLRKMSRDGLLIPKGQQRGRFYLFATKQ